MYGNSFWAPNTPTKAGVLVVVAVMVVLHFTSLTPVYDSTYLVFGWMPLQLAYDVAYHLVGVGILFSIYRIAPTPDMGDLESSGEAEERR